MGRKIFYDVADIKRVNPKTIKGFNTDVLKSMDCMGGFRKRELVTLCAGDGQGKSMLNAEFVKEVL